MIYSNLFTNYNQKRIPNWLVLFFIFIFTIIFFVGQINKTVIQSKADSNNIKRLEIVNLSPYEATIYWLSENKETGWLVYGEKDNLINKIALDNRDVDNIRNKYRNHYVTLKNLTPNKTYYFNIISENKKLSSSDNKPFIFKTPQKMQSRTKLDPVIGKIIKENFEPVNNAIIILYVENNIYPLLALTKKNGEWLIPLNYFLRKDNLEEVILTGEEKVTIEVLDEEENKSIITDKLKNISLKNETYFIGRNYDNYSSNNVLSSFTNSNINLNNDLLIIIYPQEGALIPGNKPLIKGKTQPFKEVFINIDSVKKNYSGKVISNNLGDWQYYLNEPLTKGKYFLTVEVFIDKDKLIKKSRTFNIIGNDAIEGKVLGEATGEPTTVYQSPTLTPTKVFSSPTKIISPTLYEAGISEGLPLLLGIGFFILGFGVFILF